MDAEERRREARRGGCTEVQRSGTARRGRARQGAAGARQGACGRAHAAGRDRGVATCGRARRGAARCGRVRTDDVAVAEQWLGRLEEDVVEVGEEHLLGVVKGLPGF